MCKLFSGKINLSASKIISISISENWNACFLPVQAKNTFERKKSMYEQPCKTIIEQFYTCAIGWILTFLDDNSFVCWILSFSFVDNNCHHFRVGTLLRLLQRLLLKLIKWNVAKMKNLQKWKIWKNGKFAKMENFIQKQLLPTLIVCTCLL